jgi:hypothetical protein
LVLTFSPIPSSLEKEKYEVLGRTNHLLSLIWHGPHRKWDVQQFFYCWVCIRYCSNIFTKPLPGNYRGFLPSCCLTTQTDGRDFLIASLRWAQVSWYMYQVS